MRVLWICNIVVPEYSHVFNIKKNNVAGWISGQLKALLDSDLRVEIGLVFPIYDVERRKDTQSDDVQIFSIDGNMNHLDRNDKYINQFIDIYEKFRPDIIQIWGTEYKHAFYATMAANKIGLLSKVVVHIQGIVTCYSSHFFDGVHYEWRKQIMEHYERFIEQGSLEEQTLKLVQNVLGRTEWDRGTTKLFNDSVNYLYCPEILRDAFYENAGRWNYSECQKHSIFISSAAYSIKGFHSFVEVIEIVRKKYPDIKVTIAGRNPIEANSEGEISGYGKYISHLIDEKGIADSLQFTGMLTEEEMINHMLMANVFVVPSLVENSCNSLCEAMMLGVPIVATYTGGTPSMVDHGVTGLLYQGNAGYMGAYYIRELFEDQELVMTLSKNGVQTALRRHDRKTVTEGLLEIYKNLVYV
ncbi:glycosyltransferase family 4 protein [Pseudobutyrivibrio xylanivorans]|uniref:Glycosyltransferase involved in cell wall bisynthesis n=1 Tax=Pseudobutyrivibrio xylanivorans DSM 14809 TaxID=1123012 RepID=A0A1M6DA20_PSEXY|nr:glycosyltransferase family 4 protein [Pseudobutyrivibrio xylanivorans]SHI70093.1 Glycosyltransferase involved in cell wall bisynthesis [Pseudobutyrivibrio xylanivorans DSM 14809]